ncbi:WSC domain-containing protein [Cercophora scortea]|uniref:WSC domain-containing protein n=1 Tax=Cercophora scortea TaxID=314031 RepID=A0AAE0IG80_9PEZI|nr:WSC domain-containing protein [Cercophora scortea]
MQPKLISGVLTAAAVASACTIPGGTLSNTILTPFRIQVQNASYPQVHNLYMNLLAAGGGDQHLFIGPVGTPTYDLVLRSGVIGRGVLNAVINGEYSDIDSTTKMFMTERGDPRAIYAPAYGCNPDTDALQIELPLVGRQNDPPGGWICVRPSFENSHEFRYYPPGNTKVDPNRTCIKVTLVVIPVTGGTSSSSTSSAPSTTLSTSTISSTKSSTVSTTSTTTSPSSTSSSTSTTRTSTSTTSSATSTATALPYTDMTSQGFAFIGCAPEERRVTDAPGRTLSGALYASDTLTSEICMAFCAGRGYLYAGTEWRRECWCGNSYAPTRQPATTLASLANCNYPCAGNAAQYCGGDAWLSLYKKCDAGGPCVNAVFT